MNILIFYPPAFNIQSKFNRKIGRITQNISDFKISYFSDSNNFITDFFKENKKLVLENISQLEESLTHAIIFDDGEEFGENNYSYLKKHNIVTRVIYIPITRVVNIDHDKQYKSIKISNSYQYIGRGSYWGNPYSMYDFSHDVDNSREDVIRKFKYDFDNDKFVKKRKKDVYKLVGKRLGCFCKPKDCHGDILADFLNSWDDGN